jgi:uncharacterized cupredoxin-like copper-binding protein
MVQGAPSAEYGIRNLFDEPCERKDSTMIRSRKILGVGVVMAGCGGSSSSAAPTTTPPATTTTTPATTSSATPKASQTVDVTADPSGKLEYVQKTLTAKAGTVDFKLTNASPVPHDIAIAQGTTVEGTSAIINNGSTDLTVTLKPGTYQFYCSVPGHKEAGMTGTLTVS